MHEDVQLRILDSFMGILDTFDGIMDLFVEDLGYEWDCEDGDKHT